MKWTLKPPANQAVAMREIGKLFAGLEQDGMPELEIPPSCRQASLIGANGQAGTSSNRGENMTHTPGPWHTETAEREVIMGNEFGALAICNAQRQELGRIRGVLGFEAARANAQLMAAAPVLLGACVAMTAAIAEAGWCGVNAEIATAYDAMAAAIAKTKGV